jgi:hypothetical protein
MSSIPTLCPECRKCLGEVYLAYQIISLHRRLNETKEKLPDNMILMPDNFTNEKDLLDLFRLTNDCCRTHMMTQRSKEDILAAYMHN